MILAYIWSLVYKRPGGNAAAGKQCSWYDTRIHIINDWVDEADGQAINISFQIRPKSLK